MYSSYLKNISRSAFSHHSKNTVESNFHSPGNCSSKAEDQDPPDHTQNLDSNRQFYIFKVSKVMWFLKLDTLKVSLQWAYSVDQPLIRGFCFLTRRIPSLNHSSRILWEGAVMAIFGIIAIMFAVQTKLQESGGQGYGVAWWHFQSEFWNDVMPLKDSAEILWWNDYHGVSAESSCSVTSFVGLPWEWCWCDGDFGIISPFRRREPSQWNGLLSSHN